MVIYTDATLALYCTRCGKIQTHLISPFTLNPSGRAKLNCQCGHKQGEICVSSHGQFLLTVFCELCQRNHVLCFSNRYTDTGIVQKLYCMKHNLELGFVGECRLIEQTIEWHKSAVNYPLPDPNSPDSDNPEVMLDLLNRVHDIAERGGVTCRCGRALIRAEVFSSYIELRCQTCGAYETFSARTESDLARVESAQLIELSLPCHSRKTH